MINECIRKKKLKSRSRRVSQFFVWDVEELTILKKRDRWIDSDREIEKNRNRERIID